MCLLLLGFAGDAELAGAVSDACANAYGVYSGCGGSGSGERE